MVLVPVLLVAVAGCCYILLLVIFSCHFASAYCSWLVLVVAAGCSQLLVVLFVTAVAGF